MCPAGWSVDRTGTETTIDVSHVVAKSMGGGDGGETTGTVEMQNIGESWYFHFFTNTFVLFKVHLDSLK